MIVTARTYQDKFTLDGRLRRTNGVTPAKVKAVKELLTKYNQGSAIAGATLQEALTSSDAIFNMAYLANMNFIPQYDLAPRVWTQVAGTRTAPDLRPVTLYTLNKLWTDGDGGSGVLSRDVQGAAPVIPEGTPYPEAFVSGETSGGASVVKRGFKTSWTLEARINDFLGSISSLPQEMLEVSLDTEEADVFGALITQTASYGQSALAGGLVPDGSTVLPNAPFSREAVIRAIIEISQRKILLRYIQVNGGYNLIVPVNQKKFVEFALNQTVVTATAGSYELNINGYNPLADVEVVESIYVTGSEWYLVPKPGTTRRPVLERLNLRGYETPQLFVDNLTGNYIGGASVAPFEGSFDNDTITLKLRQFGGGVVWDQGLAIVHSNGTGVA